MESDGFTPILAVFYAVFHPTAGTSIVHQVPEDSITSSANANTLFNFDTVKNYIIPKPRLCNKLILFKIDKLRVLGYPVNIENSYYARNSFNFNFGFVFPYDSDTTPYESAIERMGKMFRELEEQSFILSKLDKQSSFFKKDTDGTPLLPAQLKFSSTLVTPGHSRIKKITLSSIELLIHQVFQDLNNYSECCIPLDSANSVDIKLFPVLPPPVNIKAFQVPIATVNLNQLVDVNWDPTMVKILPYINGINSIKRVSELADADYLLVKQCVQHLMHYKCINVIDIFQFNNIYAPTNNIGNFLKLSGMAEECRAYIISDDSSIGSLPAEALSGNTLVNNLLVSPYSRPVYLKQNTVTETASSPTVEAVAAKGKVSRKTIHVPSKATLFYLYRSLNQSQTIKEWCIQHRKQLEHVDIRRFINFGVLRGIIYRVQAYPIISSITNAVDRNLKDDLDSILATYQMQRQREDNQRQVRLQKRQQRHSNGSDLLASLVHETNLQTAKAKRKVSFNYHVTGRPSLMKDAISEGSNETTDSGSDLEAIEDSDVPLASDESDYDSEGQDTKEKDDVIKLIKLLKGHQHLDSISTELQKLRASVEALLAKLGNCSIVNS